MTLEDFNKGIEQIQTSGSDAGLQLAQRIGWLEEAMRFVLGALEEDTAPDNLMDAFNTGLPKCTQCNTEPVFIEADDENEVYRCMCGETETRLPLVG